jgi:GNAT superfamily N-acetyltransferase
MESNLSTNIVTVRTLRELKMFTGFPYKLYQDESRWVPPLRISQVKLFSSRFPFWKKNPHSFFMALKQGRCVGRIAAFINTQHPCWFHDNTGCFGFLEFEQDTNVLKALLQAAENWLHQLGCHSIIGPFNPDIHNEMGILTSGFETPPFFMVTYNFPWYDGMLQAEGYSKRKDFYAYTLHSKDYKATPRMTRIAKMLNGKYKITLRHPDMKNFKGELEHFYAIYNDAFLHHWGFAPMPKDEFMEMAGDMKAIIDAGMVFILELDGEPVAFLLSLPNINEILIHMRNGSLWPFGIFRLLWGRRKIKSLRVITVAVKKRFQHLGLGAILYPALMESGARLGYSLGELSWVAEDNVPMNAVARELAGEPHKSWRIYGKDLQ